MKRLHLLTLILIVSLLIIPLFSLSGSGAAASQGPPPLIPAPVLVGYPAEHSTTAPAPLMFIENVGQFADGARFQMRCAAGTVWLADDALWLSLVDATEIGNDEPLLRGANVKLSFVGASPAVRLEPFDRLDTTVSYFFGNDPSEWHADVPVWGGVRYVGLYPGVDLEVTGEGGRWSWSLVAQDGIPLDLEAFPGGEHEIRLGSGEIRLRAEGADALDLDESGWLCVATAVGEVAIPFPSSSNQLLVADNPSELLYSTFLGGSEGDDKPYIAVNSSGEVYVTGSTSSNDFPTTPGVYDGTGLPSSWDAFVVKLDASGANLVYATYLGGNSVESLGGIAVDANGSTYVTGRTMSDDFPTTSGAYDRTHNGGNDVFVAKLNAAGSQLTYGTFIGGSGEEDGLGIALDSANTAFIVGKTLSSDFPASSGAFDTSYNGGTHRGDCFVFKLNSAGSARVYATYLGGSSDDEGRGIAVTGNGVAYIAGRTGSNDFPTTTGALDTEFGGYEDGFVVKLNADGSQQVYATYLGGTTWDMVENIAIGDGDVVYVAGTTRSSDFPVTEGAYDNSLGGGYDAYIAKLNSAGSALVYATYLGGSGAEWGRAIWVDNGGAVYIAGDTDSGDFPATAGSYDGSNNGGVWDAFAAKLDAAGSLLNYATYLGGDATDRGYAIALDGSGNVYIAGQTDSSDFPTTSGAYDQSHNGSTDVFVSKLAMAATAPTPTATATTEPCPDTYEPNEDFSEAIEIVPGTDIDSYICSSTDEDWFRFDVVAGQQITVDLTNLPADYDLRLWDPNGDIVDTSSAGGTASEHLDALAAMSGAYRTSVHGWYGVFDNSNPYRLRVEVDGTLTPTPTATMTPDGTHTPTPTATMTPDGSCPDTYEPNEDFSEAIEIVPGIDIDSYICSSTDRDWFKFDVIAGQHISVDLANLPENYDLEFYGPDGTFLAYSSDGGIASERIDALAAMSGAYRVRVHGYAGAFDISNPYRLRVGVGGTPTPTPTMTATPESCPDTYEPNEDFSDAIEIVPGTDIDSYLCSGTDEDWFRFDVVVGQQITVDLTDLPLNYELELYDPSATWVVSSLASGTASEHIDEPAAMSGAYRTLVRGYAGASDRTNPYRLRVELLGEGATPTPTISVTPTQALVSPRIWLPLVLKQPCQRCR